MPLPVPPLRNPTLLFAPTRMSALIASWAVPSPPQTSKWRIGPRANRSTSSTKWRRPRVSTTERTWKRRAARLSSLSCPGFLLGLISKSAESNPAIVRLYYPPGRPS